MSIPATNAMQRDIGDAQHALDSHQLGRWLRGSGHLSGGAATAAGGLTIEVPSDAEVLLDGETVAVDEFDNTADVTASGTMPRFSIISVESDGSVTATDGEPRELVGDDSEPARVRDPAPPLDYPGVAYAAVFVPAGASGVTDDEILDRRFGVRLASVLADQIEGESVLADEIEAGSVLADEIEGESFGLPSGWALTENAAGEVVIEDSGANVVFRRDETAGEWVTDSIDADSVETEKLVNDYHYAGAFDGSNADERLDNCIAESKNGDTIYLENVRYQNARTITNQRLFVGTRAGPISADTGFDSAVDIDSIGVEFRNVDFRTRSGTISGSDVILQSCARVNHTIDADDVAVIGCRGSDVLFNDGTEGGLANSLFGGSTATDNDGRNAIGVIN